MDLPERITKIRKSVGLTQKEFGDKIGVAGNTVTNYENGIRTPMEQTLRSICREYRVDYGWLTTGKGEMFLDDDDDLIDQINRMMIGQNDFAKRVFRAFAKMDEEEWEALERFIDRISEK